jgi:cytochrome c556
MRTTILALLLTLGAASPVAAQEDARNAIDLPADVRVQFLDHMHTHMNSLDAVVRGLAEGKIREAGATAQKQMAVGQGRGFGRYMPDEFRQLGFAYHQAAGNFARVTEEVGDKPDAAGWAKIVGGLADITTQCNACHAVFRVK